MKRSWSFAYLLLFVGFIAGTSFSIGWCLKLNSTELSTEDLCSVPEEQQEENLGGKEKEIFQSVDSGLAGLALINRVFVLYHKFPIPEKFYPEVLHSPPNHC